MNFTCHSVLNGDSASATIIDDEGRCWLCLQSS